VGVRGLSLDLEARALKSFVECATGFGDLSAGGISIGYHDFKSLECEFLKHEITDQKSGFSSGSLSEK